MTVSSRSVVPGTDRPRLGKVTRSSPAASNASANLAAARGLNCAMYLWISLISRAPPATRLLARRRSDSALRELTQPLPHFFVWNAPSRIDFGLGLGDRAGFFRRVHLVENRFRLVHDFSASRAIRFDSRLKGELRDR